MSSNCEGRKMKQTKNIFFFFGFWIKQKSGLFHASLLLYFVNVLRLLWTPQLLTPRQQSSALIGPVRDTETKTIKEEGIAFCARAGDWDHWKQCHISSWWLTQILTIDSAYDVKMVVLCSCYSTAAAMMVLFCNNLQRGNLEPSAWFTMTITAWLWCSAQLHIMLRQFYCLAL